MFEKHLKYARVEMERRFLLATLPSEVDPRSGYQTLEDLYFPGTSLRLRRVTSPAGRVIELKLNQKLQNDPPLPTHRITTSVYLGPADYSLLSRLAGGRLAKRRYAFWSEGTRFGIDVFQESLQGLVLAETEVASEDILDSVPALPVPHIEVTAEPLFCGGTLATEDPVRILERARELLA